MSMKKNIQRTVHIQGMHCKSCELLIEKSIHKIPGVHRVSSQFQTGKTTVECHPSVTPSVIERAVVNAGYKIGTTYLPWISTSKKDYQDSLIALVFVVALYFFLQGIGLFNLGVDTNNVSIITPLLIGLLAGVSTCMALVGGLVLGIAARWSESHPEMTGWQKFMPHMAFNAGRVVGFTILGGVIGLLGSVIRLSNIFLSVLTIGVGLTMMILGAKLTELFPKLNTVSITLPSGISKTLGITKERGSNRVAFLSGALTFFLPCGFTQAMQLFAMSTGNMISGGLIMGLFAVGTIPGLLSIGGLSSFFKGQAAKLFFKIAGIAVFTLGIFNIQNGWFVFANSIQGGQSNTAVVTTNNGSVQEVYMNESAYGYTPNDFTVQQGKTVRWIINAQDIFSCASSLVLPKFGISKQLQKGENIIEFTPTDIGDIPFSCSMGMYRGVFHVISSITTQQINNFPAQATTGYPTGGGGCGMMGGNGGGCSGCGGAQKSIPTTKGVVENPSQDTKEQVIKASYTLQKDIQPNTFNVQVGIPVRFEVDVQEDGQGCMSSIMIPGLFDTPQRLKAGNKLIMSFTPRVKGEYPITCAMGVPRGTIVVE